MKLMHSTVYILISIKQYSSFIYKNTPQYDHDNKDWDKTLSHCHVVQLVGPKFVSHGILQTNYRKTIIFPIIIIIPLKIATL